jgi:hypothetical protein
MKLTMPVTARVTGILQEERTEWEEDNDGTRRSHTRIIYTPVLEYEVDGKKYSESHSVYGAAGQVSIGANIAIFCNPDNPSEARYRRDPSGFIGAVITIVMGAIAVFVGIATLLG